MFDNFYIMFFSIGILVLMALFIVKYLIDDYTESDALDNAEMIIQDYCTGNKNCLDCDKYIKEVGYCKYQYYSPMRWKEIKK